MSARPSRRARGRSWADLDAQGLNELIEACSGAVADRLAAMRSKEALGRDGRQRVGGRQQILRPSDEFDCDFAMRRFDRDAATCGTRAPWSGSSRPIKSGGSWKAMLRKGRHVPQVCPPPRLGFIVLRRGVGRRVGLRETCKACYLRTTRAARARSSSTRRSTSRATRAWAAAC